MSGHSKWASIKHKKGQTDAKRGILFSKLIKEITLAARQGGDPDTNPRLRTAMAIAKAQSMPKENIEKAIKRGTGELPGTTIEEINYEGYGPAGVAILIEAISDNKNRTTAEIRHIFSKYGGNLGASGCVAWMFADKGIMYVDKADADEDALLEIGLELGIDDIETEDNSFRVTTSPELFEKMKETLENKKIKYSQAELTKVPQSTIKVGAKQAHTLLKLMDMLEEHEDVQKVHSNFDIPDEVLEEIEKE